LTPGNSLHPVATARGSDGQWGRSIDRKNYLYLLPQWFFHEDFIVDRYTRGKGQWTCFA